MRLLSPPWAGPGSGPWLIAIGGLLAMYLPSYWAAAGDLWQTDEFGHAPLVLSIALWLFWQAREAINRAVQRPQLALGWAVLGLGALLYLFGRVFQVSSVEFLSQPIVVVAMFLLLQGPAGLRAAWFAILFLVFMVPLPATLVDAATGPLKQWISALVVDLLGAAGYPIGRTGVIISIGQYQLLVADACSGLNSMMSLSALGTLFVFITGRESRWHNAAMVAAIIPIAFVANIVRVVVLVLVTYHLGDEAGQGFLHGAAGLMLMVIALTLLFALDTGLRYLAQHPRLNPPHMIDS